MHGLSYFNNRIIVSVPWSGMYSVLNSISVEQLSPQEDKRKGRKKEKRYFILESNMSDYFSETWFIQIAPNAAFYFGNSFTKLL